MFQHLLIVLMFKFALLYASEKDCYVLEKCQQDVNRLLEQASWSKNTGGQDQSHDTASNNCGLIRQKLGCIISLSSTCLPLDVKTSKNISIMLKESKEFLISNCLEKEDWPDSPCFQSFEVRNCENLFGLSGMGLSSGQHQRLCRNYFKFRECVSNYVQSKCNGKDQDNVLLYMIEKVGGQMLFCSNVTFENLAQESSENEDTLNPVDQYGNHVGKRGSPEYDELQDRFRQSDGNSFGNLYQPHGALMFPNNRFPMNMPYPNPSFGRQSAFPNSQSAGFNPQSVTNPFPSSNMNSYYHQSPSGQMPLSSRPDTLWTTDNRYSNHAGQGYIPNPGFAQPIPSQIPISRPDHNEEPGHPEEPLQAPSINPRADKCVQQARFIGRHCEEAVSPTYRITRDDQEPVSSRVNHCCGVRRFVECFGQVLQQVCPDVDADSLLKAIPLTRRQDIVSCRPVMRTECNFADTSGISKPRISVELSIFLLILAFL